MIRSSIRPRTYIFTFRRGLCRRTDPLPGVTIITALASELSGKPVRRDIAMTGEVTLRGRVLGHRQGLRKKQWRHTRQECIPSAFRAKISAISAEIDPLVRENLEFIPAQRRSGAKAAIRR